jgi:hypothetical protein
MKELYKSLAAFQQEIPTIHKDSTAGQGKFQYQYTDLPTIFEAINPLMKKHGLGFSQMVNGTQLCTTIFHVKSGESIEGCADIPQGVELRGMNPFQALGSAITYMRRYQLSAMLGLVTDKDTDASGTVEKKETKRELTEGENMDKVVKWAHDGDKSVADCKKYYTMTAKVEGVLKEKLVALKQMA